MDRNRYSASFADAVDPDASAPGSVADSAIARYAAAALASVVVAARNSADETIPDDTRLHAVLDIGASRVVGCLSGWCASRGFEYRCDLSRRASDLNLGDGSSL